MKAVADRKAGRSVYLPTPRLALAIAIGAGTLALAPVAGKPLVLLNAVWMTAVVLLAAYELALLHRSERLDVERDASEVMSLAEPADICIRLHNPNATPLFAAVKDSPPEELFASHAGRSALALPGLSAELVYNVRPAKRGEYTFGPVSIRMSSQIGLICRQWAQPAAQSVRVLPNVTTTREHALLARENRLNLMGVHLSRLRGTGLEFNSLRDWMPGDGMRNVEWKATARRRKLIAREYEFERSQNIILTLDLGRTMARQVIEGPKMIPMTKADYAINTSVLLAWVATQARDQVGLAAFGQEMQTLVPPGKGPGCFDRIMQALTPLEAGAEEPNYRAVFLRLAYTVRRRSLFIVMTDLIDPVSSESLLQDLHYLTARHLILVVAISDYELKDILQKRPETERELYRQTVAASVMADRRRALAEFEARGILTLDVAPAEATVATLNKYLQIKREGRI
ncbi:MAG: DUF58 domain-containing protein [Armatimonadetes bacterium]|nr:DUF58 domain-containing protein [Armatimonadota bacterium]